MTFKLIKEHDKKYYEYIDEKTGLIHIHIQEETLYPATIFSVKNNITNNTGVAHALEHCIFQGSQKYPLKNLGYNLLGKNGERQINATVSNDETIFLFNTFNEKGFFNLFNIFLDSILNPLLLNEAFQQEVIRIDDDTETGFSGVVFNEMLNKYNSPISEVIKSSLKSIYEDYASYDSGGHPNNIVNLTHEQIVNYHKENYHPQNMIVYTIGNLNIADIHSNLSSFLNFKENHNDKKIEKFEKILKKKKNIKSVGTHPNNPNEFLTLSWSNEIKLLEDYLTLEKLIVLIRQDKEFDQFCFNNGAENYHFFLNDQKKSTTFLILEGKNINPNLEIEFQNYLKSFISKLSEDQIKEDFLNQKLIDEKSKNNLDYGLNKLIKNLKYKKIFPQDHEKVYNEKLNEVMLNNILDKEYLIKLTQNYFQSTNQHTSIFDPYFLTTIKKNIKYKRKIFKEIVVNRENSYENIEIPSISIENIKTNSVILSKENIKGTNLNYSIQDNILNKINYSVEINIQDNEDLLMYNFLLMILNNNEQNNQSRIFSSFINRNNKIYLNYSCESIKDINIIEILNSFKNQNYNLENIENLIKKQLIEYNTSKNRNYIQYLKESLSGNSKEEIISRLINIDYYEDFLTKLSENKDLLKSKIDNLNLKIQNLYKQKPEILFIGKKENYQKIKNELHNIEYSSEKKSISVTDTRYNFDLLDNSIINVDITSFSNVEKIQLNILKKMMLPILRDYARLKGGSYSYNIDIERNNYYIYTQNDNNPEKSQENLKDILNQIHINPEILNNFKRDILIELSQPKTKEKQIFEIFLDRIINTNYINKQEIINKTSTDDIIKIIEKLKKAPIKEPIIENKNKKLVHTQLKH